LEERRFDFHPEFHDRYEVELEIGAHENPRRTYIAGSFDSIPLYDLRAWYVTVGPQFEIQVEPDVVVTLGARADVASQRDRALRLAAEVLG
jgi:hypothetical protein